jgi:hypothetical protein
MDLHSTSRRRAAMRRYRTQPEFGSFSCQSLVDLEDVLVHLVPRHVVDAVLSVEAEGKHRQAMQ